MFQADEIDARLLAAGIAPDLKKIEPKWNAMVSGRAASRNAHDS
jgi:hypothetical protein